MTVLACQRESFFLPDDLHYLNCAYMGPLPRVAEEAMLAGLRRKRVPRDIVPSDFFEAAEEARRRFAGLVNGDPERVAIVPSVSYGVALCARNLPVKKGHTIVLTGEQFPGNVYAWRRIAAERGGTVVMVDAVEGPERGRLWSEALCSAIDSRTAVVSVPHVHWTDGTLFDLEALGERARAVGAAFIVDGTQSIGALPFDAKVIRPDALVSATYKWLLGPYSMTLIHLGERFDDGVPLEETWMGRKGSEDFQHLVDYQEEYQAGARRYDVGEVANFALLPGVVTSLGLVSEWSPERIQTYCRALVGDLLTLAGERGFEIGPEKWRGEHLFGIRMRPDVELDRLKASLDEAGVIASLRGTALRVSPNVYNDQTDIGALAEILART